MSGLTSLLIDSSIQRTLSSFAKRHAWAFSQGATPTAPALHRERSGLRAGGGCVDDWFLRVGTWGGRGHAPFLNTEGLKRRHGFLMRRFLNAGIRL